MIAVIFEKQDAVCIWQVEELRRVLSRMTGTDLSVSFESMPSGSLTLIFEVR